MILQELPNIIHAMHKETHHGYVKGDHQVARNKPEKRLQRRVIRTTQDFEHEVTKHEYVSDYEDYKREGDHCLCSIDAHDMLICKRNLISAD